MQSFAPSYFAVELKLPYFCEALLEFVSLLENLFGNWLTVIGLVGYGFFEGPKFTENVTISGVVWVGHGGRSSPPHKKAIMGRYSSLTIAWLKNPTWLVGHEGEEEARGVVWIS